MRKVYLVCSLLLTLSVWLFGSGCDGGKKPEPKMIGPAPTAETPKADTTKKVTAKKPKSSGAGSTTGGGVEVPADPAGGTAEKPASDEKKPEDK